MTALTTVDIVAMRRQQLAAVIASVDKLDAVERTCGNVSMLPVMPQISVARQAGRANRISLGSMQTSPALATRILLTREIRPLVLEAKLSSHKIGMP
ncbi:hypothetical protein D3C87_1366610 [compost metagenome]